MLDGLLKVSEQLEQMGAHGMEPIMTAQPIVDVQRLKTLQSVRRSVHHGGGNSVIQRYYWAGPGTVMTFVLRFHPVAGADIAFSTCFATILPAELPPHGDT